MNSKTQIKPSQSAGGYFSRFAVAIALTCIQLTSNNASAQSIELSEQTIEQAKVLFKQGYDAYSKGDFQQAIRDYTQVIALNPNDADAYNNRAVRLALKKDYRNAMRDARKACSLGDCKVLEFLGQNSQLRD